MNPETSPPPVERAPRKSRQLLAMGGAIVLLIVAGVIFAVWPKTDAKDDATIPQRTGSRIEVHLNKDGLFPEEVSVPSGSTIVWVNEDDKPHKVVSQSDARGKTTGFTSDSIPAGQRYARPFSVAGTYKYHLEDNPAAHGTIEVKP